MFDHNYSYANLHYRRIKHYYYLLSAAQEKKKTTAMINKFYVRFTIRCKKGRLRMASVLQPQTLIFVKLNSNI